MHFTIKRLTAARIIAGMLVAAFPLAASALGLGKMTVRSALNEPLNAEVEITSITEKELRGLQVGLAGRAEFDTAGIERLPFLSQITFAVSRRADGAYFIQLRSDRQIDEPFMHILLAVEWPGGRMVREYSALIDPPTRIASEPVSVDVPTAETSTEILPVEPVAEAEVAVAEPQDVPVVEPVTKLDPASDIDGSGVDTDAPVSEEPRPEVVASDSGVVDGGPVFESLSGQVRRLDAPAAAPARVETAPAPAPRSDVRPVTSGGSYSAEGDYRVRRGDTAWRIAETMRTDSSYTVEQMVLALYRANPQAFFGNNVNNLKAGHILRIPESSEVESVTPVQARTTFRAHYDTWQEYKIRVAAAGSAITVVETESKPATTPPADTTAAKKDEAKPAKPTDSKPGAAGKDDLLTIVAADNGTSKTAGTKPVGAETPREASGRERETLAGRVTTADESLASRQLEARELSDKVAQVRAQLKREQRLLQIEQEQMAAKKDAAAPAAAVPTESAKPVATAPQPAPAKTETPAAPVVVETPKAETPAVEPPKPQTPPPATAAKPVRPPAPAPKQPVTPPPEEKSFVAELMDSVLGGGLLVKAILGGVILAIGVMVLVYFNRRRKSIAEFEESILQSEGIGNTGEPAVTTDTSGQVVSAGDTSFLSDFSQGGMGNIHTDEVDPIAEAEVYLAYGRDETAEEILKEALVKNPARDEVKLKLLEIYANRSDVRSFETMAEEMYASMGGRPNKHWPRVVELGRKLNPDNPMFRAGGGATATATAPAGFADTARMKAPPPAASGPVTTAMADVPASSGGDSTDFDFDMGSAGKSAADGSSGLDFDIGATAPASSGGDALDFASSGLDFAAPDDAGGGSSPSSSGVVDFDFGEKEDAVTSMPETEIAASSEDAAATSETGEAPQWDETATKLDLARAYIDMGDTEGARSILDEVVAEGSEQQKKLARELSAQIA